MNFTIHEALGRVRDVNMSFTVKCHQEHYEKGKIDFSALSCLANFNVVMMEKIAATIESGKKEFELTDEQLRELMLSDA